VYFGDKGDYNVIRKITVKTGIISTIAGVGSASGSYNGDNIQATSASLNFPLDVVLDSFGNLYICDFGNNRVRKVDVSTGVITTIVGDGTASSTGDESAATSATINRPSYSRFDSAGNLYITELGGNRIRKVVTVSTEIPTMIPTPTPTTAPIRYAFPIDTSLFLLHFTSFSRIARLPPLHLQEPQLQTPGIAAKYTVSTTALLTSYSSNLV
jgi:hypothetical protein